MYAQQRELDNQISAVQAEISSTRVEQSRLEESMRLIQDNVGKISALANTPISKE